MAFVGRVILKMALCVFLINLAYYGLFLKESISLGNLIELESMRDKIKITLIEPATRLYEEISRSYDETRTQPLASRAR